MIGKDHQAGDASVHNLERIMQRTLGLFLFLFLMALFACPTAAALTLITEEYPPFNYTENGSVTGATVQIVREICRRLGVSDDIQVVPWARGYQQLRNQPNVALFTTARTTEREDLFHWVGPLYVSRLAFYARQEDTRFLGSLEAIRQVQRIATYKEDYGEQELRRLGFANLDSSNSSKSNLLKLISGRVDLWFANSINAAGVVQATGIDPQKIKAVFTYHSHRSYIAISKQTAPAVVQQWQATLDDMKADGTFWWISRKWLPADAIVVTERQSGDDQPDPLKIYTEDYPPSAYVENGQLKGLSVEIVQEILDRIGQPDTITMVPWARGYNLALSDKPVALFSTTRLPQRENLFSWVGPLYHQQWGFYRWKGAAVKIPDMDAARNVARIGTYHQDAKMQYLQARGFDNLVPTNKNITNVKHLQRGNIDLWVSSDFNLTHLSRQAGVSPDQLELAYAFQTVHNFIAFSKTTSPHVIRLWQAVLDEMKADGSYQRICRTYSYAPR